MPRLPSPPALTLPTTPRAWLKEIALAYADAHEVLELEPVLGTGMVEQQMFHLAPSVCLKFRGMRASKNALKKSTEAALTSYAAMTESQPGVLSSPEIAFAFCYLAAHFGLDLVTEDEVVRTMDFIVSHEKELQRAAAGGPLVQRRGPKRPTRVWVRDPHAGGTKIPESLKEQTKQRILAHAAKHYAGKYTRLEVWFKGLFCYIDAYTEPETRGSPWKATGETREQFVERLRSTPRHLCRLRHCGQDRWSVAFYAYSSERYEPSFFGSGETFGTPEEGFEVGAVYLD